MLQNINLILVWISFPSKNEKFSGAIYKKISFLNFILKNLFNFQQKNKLIG